MMNIRGFALLLVLLLVLPPVVSAGVDSDSSEPSYLWPLPPEPVTIYGYLSFSYDADAGFIKNVSVNGTLLIERVSLPPENHLMKSEEEYSGTFSNSEYKITYMGLDNPSITIKALSEMTCSIEGVVKPERVSEGVFEISVPGARASVTTDGSVDEDGACEISLSQGEMVIIQFSESKVSADRSLLDAMSLSKVGAEVSVKGGEFTSVTYANVTVEKIYIERNRWSFRVSSEDHRGKCIIFHINTTGNLSVLIDNVPAEKGSYYDALFSSGPDPVWNATTEGEKTTVYVYVPSFTDHTVTIEDEQPPSSSSTPTSAQPLILPVIVALVLSAGALFAALRRKK